MVMVPCRVWQVVTIVSKEITASILTKEVTVNETFLQVFTLLLELCLRGFPI